MRRVRIRMLQLTREVAESTRCRKKAKVRSLQKNKKIRKNENELSGQTKVKKMAAIVR